MIERVAVIGAGRLAWSLIPNLQKAGIEVSQLISRNEKRLQLYQDTYKIPHTSSRFSQLRPDLDLVFIAVRDEAITKIAKELAPLSSPAIFVHSSGSVALEALIPLGPRIGVFYPLQIFTPDKVTPFSQTPIFVEGRGEIEDELKKLADLLSPKTYRLDSSARLRMHLGAVIACNFTNHLYKLAQDQLPAHSDLDLSVYDPLIRNTVEKAFAVGPQNSQTGPAMRGDREVLQKHLGLLADSPQLQELYLFLSKMINPELENQDSFVDSERDT